METLVIEKANTHISTHTDDALLNTVSCSYSNEGPISGVLGIMNFANANFLCVISNHLNVATVNRAKIQKITRVKLYPFKVTLNPQ